jgi:hypothetical protein
MKKAMNCVTHDLTSNWNVKILTKDGYGKNCHTIPKGNGHGKITAL